MILGLMGGYAAYTGVYALKNDPMLRNHRQFQANKATWEDLEMKEMGRRHLDISEVKQVRK